MPWLPFNWHLEYEVKVEVKNRSLMVVESHAHLELLPLKLCLHEREIKVLFCFSQLYSLSDSSSVEVYSLPFVLSDSSWCHIVSSNILSFLIVHLAFKDILSVDILQVFEWEYASWRLNGPRPLFTLSFHPRVLIFFKNVNSCSNCQGGKAQSYGL